jgi:hypothetical protein
VSGVSREASVMRDSHIGLLNVLSIKFLFVSSMKNTVGTTKWLARRNSRDDFSQCSFPSPPIYTRGAQEPECASSSIVLPILNQDVLTTPFSQLIVFVDPCIRPICLI